MLAIRYVLECFLFMWVLVVIFSYIFKQILICFGLYGVL